MLPSSCKSIRWVFDCSQWSVTASDWLKCLKSIQPEDRERIGHFVFRNDAMTSMAAQLMMRKCLVDTGLYSWSNLQLVRSEKGKPYVPNLEHVQFSVSHHGWLTVLAAEVFETHNAKEKLQNTRGDHSYSIPSAVHDHLTLENNIPLYLKIENESKATGHLDNKTIQAKTYTEDQVRSMVESQKEITKNVKGTALEPPSLGVDITKQDLPRNTAVSEFLRLMRRNFHDEEYVYIQSPSSESTQLARFYRIWALKESFVKATGTGIGVPLNEICFRVASELQSKASIYDSTVVLGGRIAQEWNFEETRIRDHYCVAVAMSNATPDTSANKRYVEVTFSDVEAMMEELELDEETEEELYYASRDFVKKQLRPWDK